MQVDNVVAKRPCMHMPHMVMTCNERRTLTAHAESQVRLSLVVGMAIVWHMQMDVLDGNVQNVQDTQRMSC